MIMPAEKERRISILERNMQEWDLSRMDTLYELIYRYYEDAVPDELIYESLNNKSEEELMNYYMNLEDYYE